LHLSGAQEVMLAFERRQLREQRPKPKPPVVVERKR
jgi:hypothetical protein